jgi:adhesin transport system membrane fusion protein
MQLEINYYNSNQKELKKNLSKQQEKLNYQKSALIDAQNKFNILVENYVMLQEEFNTKQELEKRKIFTKYEIRVLERELNDSLSAKQSAAETINQVRSQIQEIKEGMEETKLVFRNKASLQYTETIAELLRLQETEKNLQDIINRTIIRSPVDGVIKELLVHTIGSSVQASLELLTIVPDAYEMIAEVKMKPEDIAKLHIGQSVKLKVTAFDYSVYGDLTGKIINISPDTILDKETGESSYMIYIKTKKSI